MRGGRAALAALVMLWFVPGRASPDAQHLDNLGLRWVGSAPTCVAPRGWTAEHLFPESTLPAALIRLCVYSFAEAPKPPSQAQLDALTSASGAQDLTEDVPVVYASGFSTEATALFTGMRAALRAQVGDASLLARMPATPAVRIAVIDTAPDATAGHIVPGLSRHGDTLAHLIEDLVCVDGTPRRCAAEVTTELAMPWIARGVPGDPGGYLGTLVDLSRAIDRAVSTWQADRLASPATTPPRLVLNLSLGWEHTPQIADCTTGPLDQLGPPARAVRGILQYAAAQGAMTVAAAGNDAGGPKPPTGLICPGRYQGVTLDATPNQSLVFAVSAVDYQDRPLETVRPAGVTGMVALGLGGVAWAPGDAVPPALTGSSVSTAVASAVSALVWAAQPTWPRSKIADTVYHGGVDLGAVANECVLGASGCHTRRVSACGALATAGGAVPCTAPAARSSSCPALPSEVAAVIAPFSAVPPSAATPLPDPLALSTLPRYVTPSVQVQPSTFPMPISETCPTCVVRGGSVPALTIPARTQILDSPTLVVRTTSDTLHAVSLGDALDPGVAYRYPLPASWTVQSAYLTGFDPDGDSVTEQLFVAP